MLDKIPLASAKPRGVGEEFAYDIELVVAREDLNALLLPSLLVLLLHDLGVVLQNPRQTAGSENAPPQVVRFDSVWVGRIASALVPPLVERQEPRVHRHALGTLQSGTHPHFLVIHGEVHHAAPKQEKRLTWIAVALVLLLVVLGGLLRETVLQLECRDRQSVDG